MIIIPPYEQYNYSKIYFHKVVGMRDNIRVLKDEIKNKLFGHNSAGASIFLDSNGALSVFRCVGLEEYSDNLVKIKTKDSHISVSGSGLVLNTFSNSEITVSGKICTISLIGEE